MLWVEIILLLLFLHKHKKIQIIILWVSLSEKKENISKCQLKKGIEFYLEIYFHSHWITMRIVMLFSRTWNINIYLGEQPSYIQNT